MEARRRHTSGAQHRPHMEDQPDWFRMVADLQYLEVTTLEAAKRIGVPESTLRSWKNGSEPGYTVGVRFVNLWCEVTGKHRSGVPLQNAGFRRFT